MMKYKGYSIGYVEYDAVAKIFPGEVLGIKDVVTFQGTNVDEIEQAFKDSVMIIWLSVRKEVKNRTDLLRKV